MWRRYGHHIERTDEQCFESAAAEELLWPLADFLSFAAGRRIGVAMLVGVDGSGKCTWEQWGCGGCEPMAYREGWFDEACGADLEGLWPAFMELWGNPDWSRTLSEVIYWYLLANDGGRGADTGIILTQTALELLAWTYLVVSRKAVVRSGYKDLRASDQLRLLFTFLSLPKLIPSTLSNLAASAKRMKWVDSLHAFTEIRNSIVHPEKTAQVDHRSLCEAWQLGTWFLDLLILRLCKYKGKYINRLRNPHTFAKVQALPWNLPASAEPGAP